MRYVDEFRDSRPARVLREQIYSLARRLERTHGRIRIMEVCGTHTMAVARHGLRHLLPGSIELVSGPGCPVCVTVPGYIDAAIQLARRGLIVATFGDLLTVPGSNSTLAQCRAAGGKVLVCYSPLDALRFAEQYPDHEVVFLAIGFETTIAPIASMVATAINRNIRNLSLLTALKLIPPALHALLTDPTLGIDAFLCPGHVSAIIGEVAYAPFVGPGGVPCVIAGFEPLDILLGIVEILRQLTNGTARVTNCYARVV
ncbi:MAG: hydrogenase formation protein HypD, partial [Kiritimatiellae bacterium]|nr:hydrogenase formation protein HypD [Kiritimatiellia bacterium]